MGDSWILQGLIRNLRGTFELKTHPTSPLFFLQKCGLGGLVWFAVQPNFPIVNLTLLTGLWKCFKLMQPNSNGIWRSNLEGEADWLLYMSRGLAKWLKVWQNRRRRHDDRDALTMASLLRRRRDRYELKRIIFLTLLDAKRGIIRCDLEWNIYPWGKIAKKAIFPQAKVTKKAMLKPCNNQTKPQPYPTPMP